MEQTISLFLIRLFFLGFLSLPVFAQLPCVQNEKIYLLPDKNAVQPGDTLLVSGLVLESYDFSGPYSRYVHVELLDTRDSVVSRQKLNCTSAGLFGTRLAVDSFQTPGMYYVRAYTRLMRNFPAWTLPIRPVRIGMAPADPVRAAVNEIYKVRFYPEGGRLVAECPLAGRHGLFTDEGQPDEAAVDRLLIASRWKRYKWTDVLQNRLALPFQPETLLALSGRVESELGNRLKKGGEMVALDNITGFTYTGEITSDSRFRVGVDDFPEGHSFFMQAYDSKGKSYSLKIIPDNDTYPVVDNRLKYRLERKERGNAVLETNVRGEITFSYDKHNRKNYHLPEIEVAARIHQKEVALNRIYEPFKLTEEQIDQFAYPDIIPLLDRMVGFQVRKVSLDPSDNSDDPLHFRYGIFSTRGASSLRGSDDLHDYQVGEMPVILDGVLTDTHQVIMNYPPKVIHSIERLTPAKALAYTSHAFDGALLITTRGWKAAGFKSKGIRYKPPGLSPWAVPPPVLPCSLRVPAEEGVYRIVAEGVDGEGNPRRLTCEIRVKR